MVPFTSSAISMTNFNVSFSRLTLIRQMLDFKWSGKFTVHTSHKCETALLQSINHNQFVNQIVSINSSIVIPVA